MRWAEALEDTASASIPRSMEELPVTDRQISVPSESIGHLLDMIENRIREIGETYQANGRSHQDDLEITAFRAMARQLGFDFEVSATSSGLPLLDMNSRRLIDPVSPRSAGASRKTGNG